MQKRILSIVLCLAMMLSFAVPAYATNGTAENGDIYIADDIIVSDGAVTTSYDEDGNIVIKMNSEETETPAEETETPVEETEAPAEETEAPAEETEAPTEETEAPAEETEAPAEETEAPTEETEAPVEETEAPVEETEAEKVFSDDELIEEEEVVTDEAKAASDFPTLTIGKGTTNMDAGSNGVEDWYLLGEGSYGYAYTESGGDKGSCTEDYDIVIDGTNATNKTFEIVLQRLKWAEGRTLYLDLHTIWIKGGANLVFRLGSTINDKNTDQIIIRQVRGYEKNNDTDKWWFGELFWVESGSLNLQVLYNEDNPNANNRFQKDVKMVFDWDSGYNNVPSGNGPKALVSLREDATSFKANQCVFQNTQEAAITCRADDLDDFIMTDCEFQNTSKPGGNGAGIYVRDTTADTNGYYVDIHNFKLNNCTFNNSVSAGYGGAMCLMGYIHKGEISGCTFTGCQSTGQHGGAIDVSGNMGSLSIQNSTFTNCSSHFRGGAILVRSTEIKSSSGNPRWTRSNSVTISGCAFTNCDSNSSHGGAVAVQGQVHTFTVSDCDFENCDAKINGGGISIDAQDLPDNFAATGDANPNWAAALGCTTCTDYGSAMGGYYDWVNNEDSTKTVDKKSKVGTVNITNNCTFTNCSSASNGGSIEFASGCYITNSATISNTTITGSKAVGGGSAIFTSNCIVKKLNLYDDVFQNCDFNEGADDVGGTVRTTGPTTVVLDVQRCQFLNNHSYGNAGGLYWNAARSLEGITCEASVHGCLFDGNSADMYGGAIYVESKMTITKCHIKNNTAAVMGGGIAQQVYNNPSIRMMEDGDVTELKLDPETWIHHNSAPLGGGISIRANETGSIVDGNLVDLTVRFELNGAAVYRNTAYKDASGEGGHGGGIYFIAESSTDPLKQAEVENYTKVILINAGTGTAAAVYDNSAEANGGGIYMESSENTELHVQGGYISTNSANNGGGIYMTGKNATCYVEGGIIGGEGNDSAGKPLANTASGNGGGIAISGGSSIEMTGGTISYNTAAVDGGGIWLDERGSNNIPNRISIKDGSVIHNSAGNNGGGISMKMSAEAHLTGGEISHNTAVKNGGGLDVNVYAILDMSGGTIEDNTATTGNGGGVSSEWYGSVTIRDGSTIKSNKAPEGAGGGVFGQRYNIDITGGDITKNSAKNGGGVCIVSTPADGYETIISGGNIFKNTATGNGGGLYNQGCTKFTVNGGNIYENKAYKGGGIYGDSAGLTKISSGSIHDNIASRRGGGIYLDGSSISIEGGSVYENTSVDAGGGICAMTNGSTGSTVTMSGGDIYKNTTTSEGGWGGGIYVSGANSAVVLTGGNIYENDAAGCGGGINAEASSTVTVNGGNIYKNTSDTYGGGIHCFNKATVTVNGGSIHENNAGSGGGIALRSSATGTVTNSTTDVGRIYKNTANNGGGVFVEGGAHLTVNNGYITDNNATGMPNSKATAYQLNANTLKGTGGGIYIADGSEGNPSTFTLEGTNIAIYGNKADFAADDVFANGKYTKLNVPTVAGMNLEGYDFPAAGWVEDYPVNDTAYTSGMNLGISKNVSNGQNVYRYRFSRPGFRIVVPEANVTTEKFAPNVANEYVCMTLGIPVAEPDVVVVDFGLPVNIDVSANDLIIDTEDIKGFVDDQYVNKKGYNEVDPNGNNCPLCKEKEPTVAVKGQFTLNEDKHSVTFTPADMNFSGAQTVNYVVHYDIKDSNGADKFYHFYSTVTAIPATNIYYEDSFLTLYHTGGTLVTNENNSSGTLGNWVKVNEHTSTNQEQDRPGQDVDNALGNLDADNVYGYDDAYKNCTTYSLGSAQKVTVDKDTGANANAPKATFSFTGTGFDVVSLTDSDSGALWVKVTHKDETGKTVLDKSIIVNNYYGYKYGLCDVEYSYNGKTWDRIILGKSESKTEIVFNKPSNPKYAESHLAVENDFYVDKNASDNSLYQIPVIKVDGLKHGTYDVEMKVVYLASQDMHSDGSYTVWLDAIRIYNPAQGDSTAEDAYQKDGESNPVYLNISDNIANGLDTFTNVTGGFGYVDGRDYGTGDKDAFLSEYQNQGPNNEAYLKNGDGFVFKLRYYGETSPAGGSFQIGAKLAAGTFAQLLMTHNGKNIDTTEIRTSTNMFYKCPDLNWATSGTDAKGKYWETSVIYITCSANASSILSLTDLKLCVPYAVSGAEVSEDSLMAIVDTEAAKFAEEILKAEQEANKKSINLAYPTLSLEDEVKYNFYYTVKNIDVAVEDMGLITWSAKPEDATFDTAETVIPGASYNAATGEYMVRTNGIPAKKLGDDVYFRVYAKLSDGSYVYSRMTYYSAKIYAAERLKYSTSADMKAACVAMLNYGAAAQMHFDYKTDALMNADLTAEQKALVDAYSSDMVDALPTVDAAKAGEFVANGGFNTGYPTVSFEGAFAINYYFVPNKTIDGDLMLYCWDLETYNSVDVLTADNATAKIVMTQTATGEYLATYTGIAAKQIDETVFVAGVYESEGVRYSTNVVPYSVGAYCADRVAYGSDTMKVFAAETAVFGHYAEIYFDNLNK